MMVIDIEYQLYNNQTIQAEYNVRALMSFLRGSAGSPTLTFIRAIPRTTKKIVNMAWLLVVLLGLGSSIFLLVVNMMTFLFR